MGRSSSDVQLQFTYKSILCFVGKQQENEGKRENSCTVNICHLFGVEKRDEFSCLPVQRQPLGGGRHLSESRSN